MSDNSSHWVPGEVIENSTAEGRESVARLDEMASTPPKTAHGGIGEAAQFPNGRPVDLAGNVLAHDEHGNPVPPVPVVRPAPAGHTLLVFDPAATDGQVAWVWADTARRTPEPVAAGWGGRPVEWFTSPAELLAHRPAVVSMVPVAAGLVRPSIIADPPRTA